jgi:hypothetical protein
MGHHGVRVDHGTGAMVWNKKPVRVRLVARVEGNNDITKCEIIIAEGKVRFEVRNG